MNTYDDLKAAISQGKWARGPWSARLVTLHPPPPQFSPICFDVENVPSNTCLDKEHDLFTTLISSFTQFNSDEDELKVKEETGATIRCFPFEQPQGVKTCLMTGNPAEEVAIFSKSY